MKRRICSVLLVMAFAALLWAGVIIFGDTEETGAFGLPTGNGAPLSEAVHRPAKKNETYLEVIERRDAWDTIMERASRLFEEQGAAGLLDYDGSNEVAQATFEMCAAGRDRYVCPVGADRYAMLYLNIPTGGYWWYFGEMEDGIRSGRGATVVILPRGAYQVYSGGYAEDFPEGHGTFLYQNGRAYYRMEGEFHGPRVDGRMTCTMYNAIKWPEEVTVKLDYADGHLATPCDIPVEPGREIFMFAYLENGGFMGWENATDALDAGFEVYFGNRNLLRR